MCTKPCCAENDNMSLVKTYDPKPKNKDGSIRWFLFRWDDGKDGFRRLMKCSKCGAFYLVQAFHLYNSSVPDDVLFEDWYYVENEQQADLWNRKYTGIQLEQTIKPIFHKKQQPD